MDSYVLNPEERDYTIYSIDTSDSNLPMSLSKGPYYEVLEQIPINKLMHEMEYRKREQEREQERLAQAGPDSSMGQSAFLSIVGQQSSPRFQNQPPFPGQSLPLASPRSPQSPQRLRSYSPPRSASPVYRQELGLTDAFDQPLPSQAGGLQQTNLFIREWKISQAVELSAREFYGRYDRAEEECSWSLRAGQEANFVSDNAIYLCNPGNILSEYIGLYRISKPFTRITRRVPTDGGVRESLYSGGQLVGTFEKPQSIRGIPGQFDFLPNDIQIKIAGYLEPDDLIMFCNVNIKNRRLCQNPERSIWVSKLLQLNPNTHIDRISDPFHYFLRYYYGGQLLTMGSNSHSQLGRPLKQPVTMQKIREQSANVAIGVLLDQNQAQQNQGLFMERSSQRTSNSEEVDLQPRVISDLSIEFDDRAVVDVSCGAKYTVAVLKDGTVISYGANSDSQRGPPTGGPLIPNVKSALKVSCGLNHTAILLRDGRVLTFGSNHYGKLGRDRSQLPEHNTGYLAQFDRPPRSPRFKTTFGMEGQAEQIDDPLSLVEDPNPLEVPGITSAVSIACGYEHTVILLSNGRIVTFGNNAYGQLGRETLKVSIPSRYNPEKMDSIAYDKTPVVLESISTAVQIGAGADHTVVVLKDGRVVSFGRNKHGQLGRATPLLPKEQHWHEDEYMNGETPEIVTEFATAVDVSCGVFFTAILLKDGRVATFGDNEKGQLGRVIARQEYAKMILAPAPIPKLTNAVSVAGGSNALAVTLKNGSVVFYGQLVDTLPYGSDRIPTAELAKPKVVRGVNTAIGAAVGYDHAAILVMNKGW
jgi:alpha-tubulin suppressor-like RCC1 family protein